MVPFMKKQPWYTLVEVVIATAITSVIIIGISIFIANVIAQIQIARQKGQLFVAVTQAVGTMKEKRNLFWSGIVFGSGHSRLLLYGKGFDNQSGSWALIGVVNLDLPAGTGWYLLDPENNYPCYGKKVLGIARLSGTQAARILARPETASGIIFYADNVYPDINVNTLLISPYGSGMIFDLHFSFYDTFFPDLVSPDVPDDILNGTCRWAKRDELGEEGVSTSLSLDL